MVNIHVAMTSNQLSFSSVEIDKNYSNCFCPAGGNVCVTGGHMTSCNQGLSPNDQERQRRKNLGTRLHQYLVPGDLVT